MSRVVILAEHDESSKAHLSQALTTAGYEVIAVDTARQAIEQLLSHGSVLVVASMQLPDMDGVEFAKTIADHEGIGITYIILLSEKSDEDRFQEAFSLRVADCLRKPIDDSVLIARLSTGERMLAIEKDLLVWRFICAASPVGSGQISGPTCSMARRSLLPYCS